jgi:hypothetical protein
VRFCQLHWENLRAAITARSPDGLVARDGKAAAARMKREIESGPDNASFDPLMAAHNAIVANAAHICPGGLLTLMSPNADGSDRCPLCYLNNENPMGHNYDVWIEMAADNVLEEAQRRGLVATS